MTVLRKTTETSKVDQEKILQLVDIIRRESKPSMIILFGSQARGTATEVSDFDIMVVMVHLADRRREMVKLARLVSGLGVRTDILVVSEKTFQEWRDTPGNIYFEAAQDGRVLFDDQAA
jgi:predicted nucleotidyltransferase